MILRPQQIFLCRMGLPAVPANKGGSSSSASSSDQTTNTTNTDKRIATESGLVATEGSSISSVTNIQSLDKDIVSKALETVQVADATNGDSFNGLLNLADRFLTATKESGRMTTDAATTLAGRYTADVMDGISKATADKTGSIDQKTMMVLATVAGVAFVASRRSK